MSGGIISKLEKMLITWTCLAGLLAACAAPPSPPAAVSSPLPTSTEAPPTTTAIPLPPTPTSTPQPLSGFFTIQMFNQAEGWATTVSTDNTSRLLRTGDGGQTWSDVTPAILPTGSLVEFFLSENSAWAFSYTDPARGLAHTVDAGKTWQMLPGLPIPADFVATAIAFQDEDNGWFKFASPGAGTSDIGFFTTRDGGSSWSQAMLTAPPGLFDLSLSAIPGTLHTCTMCRDVIYFDLDRVMVVYGDLNAPGTPSNTLTLSISMDVGRTWKDLKLTPPASGVINENELPLPPVFFDRNDGLLPFGFVKYDAALNIGQTQLIVYATHDGGLTWESFANSLVQNVNVLKAQDLIDFVSPQTAFVPCGSDLCATNDGGRTWQTVKSNLNYSAESGTEYVQRMDFVDSNTGWAITTNGNDYNLWKTLDGGASWEKLSSTIVP